MELMHQSGRTLTTHMVRRRLRQGHLRYPEPSGAIPLVLGTGKAARLLIPKVKPWEPQTGQFVPARRIAFQGAVRISVPIGVAAQGGSAAHGPATRPPQLPVPASVNRQ